MTRSLSERDWKVILTGATLVAYEEGAVVLEAGTRNTLLWQIKAGSALVVHEAHAELFGVGELGPGDVFGEISMLQPGALTTATIVAQTKLLLYQIQPELVAEVCRAQPDISAKLHLFLALRLAERLASLGADTFAAGGLMNARLKALAPGSVAGTSSGSPAGAGAGVSAGVALLGNSTLRTSLPGQTNSSLLKKLKATLLKRDPASATQPDTASGPTASGSGSGAVRSARDALSERDALFYKLFKLKGEVVVRGALLTPLPACAHLYAMSEIACDWIKDKKKVLAGTL